VEGERGEREKGGEKKKIFYLCSDHLNSYFLREAKRPIAQQDL
jgi:hypothetical protein